MALPVGWDRYDRWSLRFADAVLERSYQRADQVEGIRRVRTASLGAIVVWVFVALVAPSALGITSPLTVQVPGGMIIVCLMSAGLSHWATTQLRRDVIGIGQQLAACIAVLILTVGTGLFEVYGMPGVMLTCVFGFSVTRHPFIGSVAIGGAYLALFLAAAMSVGLGSPLAVQGFLVAATIVAACVGSYLLERSQRMTFAQGRLVIALHERVDQLLHQYLSPEVATTLIRDPSRAALGGEEVEVTVLFADLRGYTTYSEGRAPTEIVAMLNAAFGIAVPIILAHGGTVIDFMGDAVMAIWNAPQAQPDHALRAARAALGMQSAIAGLPGAAERPRFRVGLNSGPALVGNIGATEIRTYSAIGDTTNLAARLQTWAPEGSVVIGAGTYALIRDEAIVRPLGTPELKGKSVAVEVFELVGLR